MKKTVKKTMMKTAKLLHSHAALPASRRPARRQGGVAIITALVVVAAATVVVSGMLWRQSVAVRKIENQAAASQARWVLRGTLDWARIVLLDDARASSVDHLGEAWAAPLKVPALEAAAASPPTPGGAQTGAVGPSPVTGHMTDAQARYNLANLIAPPVKPGEAPTIDPRELNVLRRLLILTGLGEEKATEQATLIAARMLALPRPRRVDELAGEPGFEALNKLAPYIVILPQVTPVNLNTAGAEVLSARFDKLPLPRARALVEGRRRAHFTQVADVAARLPDLQIDLGGNEIATSSQFFEVDGEVRQDRVELAMHALVERGNNGATRVLEFREL